MSNPTIIFVPGFWEGPYIFAECKRLLQEKGYRVFYAWLVSTNSPASEVPPENPDLNDDVAHVRHTIESFVNRGHNVLLVVHSGGGPICSNAIEGLSLKEREAIGKKGGIVRIAFVAATAFPEGPPPPDLPFANNLGPEMFCKAPRALLFNDVSDDQEAENYIKALECQPAYGYIKDLTYCGWRHIPSTYLVCEKDALIPPEMQRQFAQLMQSHPIRSCDAGHMAIITASKAVSDFVIAAAEESI